MRRPSPRGTVRAMTDAPVRRADGLRLFAITCGWLTAPGWALLDGEDDRIRIPVPCYLIDHPKGRILFDSGLSLGSCGNARDYLGPLGENFDVHFEPSEAISSRLAAMEIDVGDITLVVTSHLHFDHAGGLAQFPNVPVARPATRVAGRSGTRPCRRQQLPRRRLRSRPRRHPGRRRARPVRRWQHRLHADLRPHARAPVAAGEAWVR